MEEATMTRCRIGLLVILAFSLFVALCAAEAQPPGKVARVGYLATAVPDCSASATCQTMAQRLQELGYAEGQNLRLEFRTAAGQAERLPDLAAELGRLQVDVIVAAGPEATLQAARHATRTIPIVMIAVDYDPIALGYIVGLPQPGGNITGVVLQHVELTGKRLEFLKVALPQLRRVAVLWDAPSADQWRAATEAAWGGDGYSSTRWSSTRRPTSTRAPLRPRSKTGPRLSWS
jgi:putative tryptophan/tyrosine transport system substrate-binding protein